MVRTRSEQWAHKPLEFGAKGPQGNQHESSCFLTVHHRFSPVPSSQAFLGGASSEEKESSTGDEQ
jgi:hypothetical protein